MTTLMIGPEHGTLTLHTGVEGKAAKAGHALTIVVKDWSAGVTFDGAEPTEVALRAAVGSIEVTEGHGGLKPLSDKDKRSIVSSALDTMKAPKHPEITFTSAAFTATGTGYDVDGVAELAGTSGPVHAELVVTRADGSASIQAVVPIEQTAFGIKPYSGMLGALKVSDRVEIKLDVTVPQPA